MVSQRSGEVLFAVARPASINVSERKGWRFEDKLVKLIVAH